MTDPTRPGSQTSEYEITKRSGNANTLIVVLSIIVAMGTAALDALEGVDVPSGIIASIALVVAMLSAALRTTVDNGYVNGRNVIKVAALNKESRNEASSNGTGTGTGPVSDGL